jgi:RNA polymerase sigma factor (sigma-70 family)
MQTGPQQPLQPVSRLLAQGHLDVTDGCLLNRFLSERDESAFGALVQRHGSMVLGVCRRILGNGPDAEDAFQATFLILVRRASEVATRTVLGDWLHGVARRVALKARTCALQRRAREAAAAVPEARQEEGRNDWLPLLDEELARLPEKYRLPIVLCDLQQRTRTEAARQLGWPEGTVATRLARGRALLAKRLLRRALTISGGLTPALVPGAAMGAVPTRLLTSTIGLALGGQMTPVPNPIVEALARSVLHSTKLSRTIVGAIGVVFLGATLGAFGMGRSIPAFGEPNRQPISAPPARVAEHLTAGTKPVPPDNLEEARRLDGTWTVIDRGSVLPVLPGEHTGAEARWIIEQGSITYGYELKQAETDRLGRYFRVDGTKKPKTIEIMITPKRVWDGQPLLIQYGVYELAGDRLKIYIDESGQEHPTDFPRADDVTRSRTLILERERPKARIAGEQPGNSAGANDPNGAGDKSTGRIDAEVRGVLKFETGRGYVIDTHSGFGYPSGPQVYLVVPENKVKVRQLQGLLDKPVTATGVLAHRLSADERNLSLELDYSRIEQLPDSGEKARMSWGVRATVRGVLKYQNARVEGGGGYHIVLSTKTNDHGGCIETRVWLQYIRELNQKKIEKEKLLGREVVVTGWLQQVHLKDGTIPYQAMYFHDFEIPDGSEEPKTPAGQPPEAKRVGRIDAEARGVLKHETGRSYFIDTSNGSSASREIVWFWLSEDKFSGARLQSLLGKEVIATGALAQMSASHRTSVPGLGMYFNKVDIEQVPDEPDKAKERRGLRATVWGVLRYENPRVEGGGGYHLLLTSGGKEPIETRVWLDYSTDGDPKKIKNYLDKEVVVRGLLQQASAKAGRSPDQAMYFHEFELREATAEDQKEPAGVKRQVPPELDRSPSNQRVWYTLEGTKVGYYILSDGKIYPGTVRDGVHIIWHRAEPLLLSQYPFGGNQPLRELVPAHGIDYRTEPIPVGLKRMTAAKENKD